MNITQGERVKITTHSIRELRDQCGAGIMDCRKALLEAEGDTEKALQIIKEQGLLRAQKKAERITTQGLVAAYIHAGGRIGAMVEVNCETDFVARTEEFKELAHHLAMQIAAMNPRFILKEEIPEGDNDTDPQIACLLLQPDIMQPDRSIQDAINETIAKLGENIKVSKFARFEVGGQKS
jgi:elongation factor Ts